MKRSEGQGALLPKWGWRLAGGLVALTLTGSILYALLRLGNALLNLTGS